MKLRWAKIAWVVPLLLLLGVVTACGGGSSSPPPPPPPPPPPSLTITSGSILPGTLSNHPYSATLQAANGVGALKWSIAPVSPTTLFVDGLSIDPSTGVLSGTAQWGGTAGFTATVTDSASPARSASKGFSITASDPLQASTPQSFVIAEYQTLYTVSVNATQGVQPLTFSVTGGSFPAGLRLNPQTGSITGSAIAVGTYVSTVTIQDSYTPPEVVTTQLTLQVVPPALTLADSLPRQILLNRPFQGRVVARGGTPPYHFVLTSGTLPSGLGPIDSSSGRIQGTPTKVEQQVFTVTVTDSSSPSIQSASWNYLIAVTNPLGRNDTIANATPISNGVYMASISPYIDPPDSAPLVADNDYYKLVSLSGATVQVATQARNQWPDDPLDTVLEILDGNGNRLANCNQPAGTTTTFTSPCINDDSAPGVTDSWLYLKVPGPANTPTTFYAHVLDWRGDARPDMTYVLQVNGVVDPLRIQTTSLLPASRGLPYSQQLSAANAIGAVNWTLAGGSLPPGLNLGSSGVIAGTATTDGVYPFTVQAADSGTPPQTATAQESIQVGEPVKITTSATLPDACLGVPYSFTVQTSGGLPPLFWSAFGYANGINFDQNQTTHRFWGTATGTPAFTGTIVVVDATTNQDSQNITINAVQCP